MASCATAHYYICEIPVNEYYNFSFTHSIPILTFLSHNKILPKSWKNKASYKVINVKQHENEKEVIKYFFLYGSKFLKDMAAKLSNNWNVNCPIYWMSGISG